MNTNPLVNEKRQNPPNVRFWEFINMNWVKITLKHEQCLSHSKSGPTDEGYSYESSSYSYTDGCVYREWENGGSDCDGPIRRNGTDICPVEKLASIPAYISHDKYIDHLFNGVHIHRPDWGTYKKTRVHDAFAQSMGY